MCHALEMKSGKRHLTDGMGLPNKDKIKTLGEKEIFKYLGILKADNIKQVKMKEKFKKKYLRTTRNLLETKLCSRNLIKGINTLFTNPFTRAGYDTTSIFKRSLTCLNSEFSFS